MAKIKIEDIRQECSDYNWILISDSYTNLNTEIILKCPEGHTVNTTYGKWRANHKCPSCENNSLKNITKEVKVKGNNIKRILAIDQALNVTGYSIFDNDILIKYGTTTQTKSSQPEKIHGVKEWLACQCELWKPDLVVLEDIQLENHSKERAIYDNGDNTIGITTFKALAQLQGVLIDYLHEAKIEYIVVFSGTWRKLLEIKGKTKADKKKSAQLKVKEWYDISVTNDEADAICLGKYGNYSNKRSDTLIQW